MRTVSKGAAFLRLGVAGVLVGAGGYAPAAMAQSAAAAEPGKADEAAAGTGQPAPATETPVVLAPVTVEGAADTARYGITASKAGTKTDTPIKETPATINVVSRQLLDDRQPKSFVEALRTVPGISATSSRISTQNLQSRGFSLRQNGGEFRNGLRHFENSNLAPEIANAERFEILKGPASVLYGLGGVGGLLNVVTKQPDGAARNSLSTSVGNYGFYRGEVDVGDAIDENGTWRWRMSGSAERAGSFQDDVDQQTVLLAPSLKWQPSEATSLVLDFEFLRGDFDGNLHGIPADGTVLPSPSGPLPRNLSVFDRDFNRILREQVYAGYLLDHRINDSLSLHQGFLFATSKRNRTVESNGTGFVGGTTGERRFLNRTASAFEAEWSSFTLDSNLTARFETAGLRHEFLAGVDLYRSVNDGRGFNAPLPALDVTNPDNDVEPTAAFTPGFDSRSTQEWAGVYLQETFIPHETLRLVAAGRITAIATDSENRANPAASRKADDLPLTPRFGLVWTPIPAASLYASYSTSFTPVAALAADGRTFDPEEGVGYEAGVKLSGLDERLLATVSIFDQARQNVSTADPDNPGFSIQTGEQTSKGIEVEVAGDPLPGFSVQASYTYLETEVSRDNALVVGQPLRGVPQHAASFYTRYTIPSGRLRGLGAGVGVFYEGERWGQLVTPANAGTVGFFVPDYVRADLQLHYRQPRYEVNLVINNLTDVKYFSGVLSRNLVYFGDPFSAILSLRLHYG